MYQNNASLKPKDKGNAKSVNEVCLPVHPLILLRYEAIADFYTEEPSCINIKLTENDDRHFFEQVLRIRLWIPNQKITSWCVYSENREWIEGDNRNIGLIIRNVIWERSLDLQKMKESTNVDKENMLNAWPNILIKNIYLRPQYTSEILKTLIKVDKILAEGIFLTKRNSEERLEWQDIEVMRLFDWGQVHTTWCPLMENKDLEKNISVVWEQLEQCIRFNVEEIFQMDLDYSYPTDSFKQLVYGEKN